MVTQQQIAITRKVLTRIAKLKIRAYSLKCTPEEYVKMCQEKYKGELSC